MESVTSEVSHSISSRFSSLILAYTFPPSPSATRGLTTVIDANANKSKIAYCVSNVVIIRDTAVRKPNKYLFVGFN